MAEAPAQGSRMKPRLPRRLAHALVTASGVALGGVALAMLPAAGATAAASATDQAPGERVYARWCVHCHAAGRGNPGTQSLQVKYAGRVPAVLLERTDLTPAAVAVFVRQGVQSMPPFRKTEITDAELAALSAWVAGGGGRR
jgi:mono/diheme cytochrome c family protein